jgi:hypothetical protein
MGTVSEVTRIGETHIVIAMRLMTLLLHPNQNLSMAVVKIEIALLFCLHCVTVNTPIKEKKASLARNITAPLWY